jgi:hypothetical protein
LNSVLTKQRLWFLLVPSVIASAWMAFALGSGFLLRRTSQVPGRMASPEPFAFIVDVFHLHEPPTTLLAPWFAEGVLLAGTGTLLIGLLSLVLDRDLHSARALRWSLRTLPCLIAWLFIGCVLAWIAGKLPSPSDAWAIAIFATVLVTPAFICLRPDAVAKDRPAYFWLPRWPGLPAIVLAMLAVVFWYGAQWLPTELDTSSIPKVLLWPAAVLYSLLALVLSLMVVAYAISAWLHRWRWSQLAGGFQAPRLLAGARVLAALGLQFGWISLLLFFPTPFLIEAVINSSAAYLEHAATPLPGHPPAHLSLLIAISRFTISYWWLCIGIAMGSLSYWMPFASMGRAIHLMDTSDGSPNETPVAPASV